MGGMQRSSSSASETSPCSRRHVRRGVPAEQILQARVMTASSRFEAMIASHAAARREKVGLEQVETPGKETPTGQLTKKSSQVYVTTK